MAVDLGGLVVKLEADISGLKAGLDTAAGKVKDFGVGTVAIGALVAEGVKAITESVLHFTTEAVMAYGEHEQAMTRLNHLVGTDTAEAFLHYAESLQETTTFSQDAVLALESQLTAYGVLPGSIASATKAALDFAAQTGRTAEEAGTVFGQALRGQSRELGSYGLQLYAGATRTENLARVTEFLEGKFHGMAEEMKGTTLGSLESLDNRIAQLKERIGSLLTPAVVALVGQMEKLVNMTEYLTGVTQKNATTTEGQIKLYEQEKVALMTKAELTGHIIDGHVVLTKAQRDELVALTNKIKGLREEKTGTDAAAAAIKGHTGALDKDADALQARFVALQKQILDEKQMYAGVTTVMELETQKQVAASENGFQQQATFSEALAVKVTGDYQTIGYAAVQMASSAAASFNQSTAQVIVEGGRMRDVLSNVFHKILEDFIAMCLQMIEQWLVVQAVTGGAGGSLGGFIGGLGRHAEGGMVTEPTVFRNLRTGETGLMGEAGPEAIVPVGQAQPREAGAATGGGAVGVTVNISGQFLDGNPATWQRLIREHIVPEIRRYTDVNPNSNFTRVRGQV